MTALGLETFETLLYYVTNVSAEVRIVARVNVPVPAGITASAWKRCLTGIARNRAAVAHIAAVMEQEEAEVGPATAGQLAAVEHLWRHLMKRYGVYSARDIAELRGAKATNRSLASKLAKKEGLLGYTRGRAKVYPRFQFKGQLVHPNWNAVSAPLTEAGWDDEDILLWMVAPSPALDGHEPAELIDTPRAAEVIQLAEREALGVW